MVEFLGGDRFRDRGQILQLDHGIIGAAHEDIAEIAGRTARIVLDLHDDVVLFRTQLEPGHVATAQHRLERTPDIRDVGTDRRDFGAIHVDLELGLVELEVGIGIGETRVLAHLRDQALDDAVQFLPATGRLHNETDRLAEVADTEWRGRNRERADTGDAAELGEQGIRNLLRAAIPLPPVDQLDEGDGVGDAVEAHEAEVAILFR